MNNVLEYVELAESQTMTSLEIVALINELREEGSAELRHDNFMGKATKVLGEEGVLNFKDTYINTQNGQEYHCLALPKREATLMIMSESYKVQAAVYDRMVSLEKELLVNLGKLDEDLEYRNDHPRHKLRHTKRSFIADIADSLGIHVFVIECALYRNGYMLYETKSISLKALFYVDIVDNRVYWDRVFIIKLLKSEGVEIFKTNC
jgi:hypothetical protein